MRELNAYLAALDILEARDVEDNSKIKHKFAKKLHELQTTDLNEDLHDINICLRDYLENQLADAYEIVISFRVKHYEQFSDQNAAP